MQLQKISITNTVQIIVTPSDVAVVAAPDKGVTFYAPTVFSPATVASNELVVGSMLVWILDNPKVLDEMMLRFHAHVHAH